MSIKLCRLWQDFSKAADAVIQHQRNREYLFSSLAFHFSRMDWSWRNVPKIWRTCYTCWRTKGVHLTRDHSAGQKQTINLQEVGMSTLTQLINCPVKLGVRDGLHWISSFCSDLIQTSWHQKSGKCIVLSKAAGKP